MYQQWTAFPTRTHPLAFFFARIITRKEKQTLHFLSRVGSHSCRASSPLLYAGKTPEEIRKTFNIRNDFTPEEEEEVRRENQWAFE